MTNTRVTSYLFFFLVISLALVSCSSEEQKQPLRIGTFVWLGYEPLFLAKSLGYLPEDDFRLVEYVSAQQTMRAIRNGTIDLATFTLDEALKLYSQGYKIKIILIMDFSNGGDAIVAKPPFKTMQDLKNKRVGLDSNTISAYVLSRALDKSEMKPADIQAMSISELAHTKDFLSGKLDAVVTFDPYKSELISNGANVVFDSTQIPGEIVDVLIVSEEVLEKEKDKIKQLMTGWYKTVDYMKSDFDKAATVLKRRMKLTEDEVKKASQGIKIPDANENSRMLFGVNGGEPGQLRYTKKLLELMQKKGLINSELKPAEIFPQATYKNILIPKHTE